MVWVCVMMQFAVVFVAARASNQGVQFEGTEQLTVDLTAKSIAAERNRISFRLKTISSFGLILYSRGTQGDYIVIDIVQGRLRYQIDLGSTKKSRVSSKQELIVGKNLDDNEWHSVDIIRDRSKLNITIDETIRKSTSSTGQKKEFMRLDLDDTLFVGGVFKTTYIDSSLEMVTKNYVGCLSNFLFGDMNILYNVKRNAKNYQAHGDIQYKCKELQYAPVTFPDAQSMLRIPAFVAQSLSLQLNFRTYEKNGLLLSKLSNDGKIYIEVRDAKLVIRVKATGKSPVVLTTGNALNDGSWHAIDCLINSEEVSVKLDKEKVLRYRTPSLRGVMYDAPFVTLGGGAERVLSGFQGCVYDVKVDYTLIDARVLPAENRTGVLLGQCAVTNKCWPNPCNNGGQCSQKSNAFKCDCTNTLYNGPTCSVPLIQRTCQDYKSQGIVTDSYCTVDPDGAGPAKPFEVLCNMTRQQEAVTIIPAKNSMKRIKISQITIFGKGKYYHNVDYDLPSDEIISVIRSNSHCRQFVRYECKNSLLLNSPKGPSHVRWVSREGIFEDYWGGAPKDSFKCACGVTKTCSDATKYCNCDRGDNFWREDSGFIKDKEKLPIKMIQFDVNTSSSYFAVGNLECTTKTTSTPKPASAAIYRACRPVDPAATTTTSRPTTIVTELPQTEKVLKSKKPRKFLQISTPGIKHGQEGPTSPTSQNHPSVFQKGGDNKKSGNRSLNAINGSEKIHDGVTISMSILAVIVISASVVVVWAIIAVIVIVRRKRHHSAAAVNSPNSEQDAEDGTEMCIFFRQSKRDVIRPTIELQPDRDSYDSSPEPSALDYTEYTGFRQPITTHITLDYSKAKKKKSSSYFC
eukprot:gene19084-21000_t